ncbi:MAG TPA: response regulator [Candidatus Hydrogenedentes bacterium]|nr:response regulator [Candidatus Hydrogenedentota bacterium]
MKNVILLADNQPEDRTTWQRVLTNAGYEVRLAKNPEEAREMLQTARIDMAIIDLRLIDDNDANDISGLVLAKERAYRHIPKIILTAFGVGYGDLREALGLALDELPPTVAFMKKDESPQILIEVIRKTLETWPRLRVAMAKVSDQIKNDHEETRRQARLNYGAAFGLSVLGAFVMFAGIGLAWLNQLAIGLVGTTGGILVEVLSYLFFARVNLANDRQDAYHQELLQTYWFEFLLAACEELPFEKRSVSIERAIDTAINSWLVPSKAERKTQEGRK